ncbi:MAG TPA: mechanosensitive ion channel family protein [Actinomycetales bacterium]|nr:mechanosensitive ion channel family protein [Actinomycetales bacterium]
MPLSAAVTNAFVTLLASAPTAPTTPTTQPTPTPSPTDTQSTLSENLDPTNPCTAFCGVVRDLTGNEDVARWVAGIGDTVLRVVLIVVVGLLLRWLLHRAITRLSEGIASGSSAVGRRRVKAKQPALVEASPLLGERRAQRARTIGSVLKSVATGLVATIVGLLLLGEFGVNLGPLLAGAGVAGVALGFGSQTLVKDFLSGVFMIVEDQYGVGDVVDLGEAAGTVEAVGLRVTRLRDVNGTVWYVRNGEIMRVGNQSQGWARAVLDISVAYGEDVGHLQEVLKDVATLLAHEEEWSALVLDEPEVWGVEALTENAVVLRLVVKTVPLEQWKVARELRRRIKARFDAEGVELPFTQRTVWLRQEEPTVHRSRRDLKRLERGEPPGQGEADVAAEADKTSNTGL